MLSLQLAAHLLKVFLDEVNSSVCGGLIKEIMVDRRLMGEVSCLKSYTASVSNLLFQF